MEDCGPDAGTVVVMIDHRNALRAFHHQLSNSGIKWRPAYDYELVTGLAQFSSIEKKGKDNTRTILSSTPELSNTIE